MNTSVLGAISYKEKSHPLDKQSYPENSKKVTIKTADAQKRLETPVLHGQLFSSNKETRIVSTLVPEKKPADLSINTIELDKTKLQNGVIDVINGELTSLFDSEKCLQGCSALTPPICTIDGSKKDVVKTFQCENLSDILLVTNQLKSNEVAFIIYRRKWSRSEHLSIDVEVSLTFTMLTNQGSNNEPAALNIVHEEFYDKSQNTQFFGIKFDLWFDKNKKLREVGLLRGVNPDWRRKKICTQVSLNCLELLFNNYSHDEPQLNFTASHIGTVKFCYPLNPFYHRETKKHLRDINPEHSDLKLSEIIRYEDFEDYSEFHYHEQLARARCPHQSISLRTLLLQYKLRRILDQV